MPNSNESDSQNSGRSENNESEARIAAAIIDVLQPQLNAIAERLDGMDQRLDGVDKQLAGVNALIVANHEDIKSLDVKLTSFQEESRRDWERNREVMNQLVTDVTYLMDR